MDSCNFTDKGNNSILPEMEIHARQEIYHIGGYVGKAKLLCQKGFVPVLPGHPGYSVSSVHIRAGEDFLSWFPRTRSDFHMNTSKFYEGKSGEARFRKPNQSY